MTQHRRDHLPNPDLMLRAISLMRQVASAINEWQRTQVKEGFTINQALVLHYLVNHGDTTPSDLADWMHVTRGSVTPAIQRLEYLGLVKRGIDESDARIQWLRATQEAKDIAAQVEAQALHPVFSTFQDWPEPALKQFCDNLERILSIPFLGNRP